MIVPMKTLPGKYDFYRVMALGKIVGPMHVADFSIYEHAEDYAKMYSRMVKLPVWIESSCDAATT